MNWLKEVSEAPTHDALLAIVNDYLLQHSDDFWSWIPRGSRPTLVASVREVHEWHRRLNEDLASATRPNVRMQDVCVFFLRASARALEIDHDRAIDECTNDGDCGAPKTNGGAC